MVSARFRRHSRGLRNHFAATSYPRRAAKLASTLRFSASNLRHISGNFRRKSTTLCKKAAKFSQQKADSATLCKILPSTWSDRLEMTVTPSFQLRIAHRCTKWTSESAPKVRKKTAAAVLCFPLHSVFPLLHCSFLAYFERLWQRAMELQGLVLHEFELPKALP
uniref:Uncharacterized protein n=1 Tax=Vitis vinifera TaxID=29760 RepID=A5BZE9_VITVI|nr:hypothetical protein VITISV_020751 [Vitis vinifera]